ncbi:MAG: hypothetical protein ABI051_00430 [Vicinamibacterales bacterium]
MRQFLCSVLFVSCCVASTPAGAQELASSFNQLRVLVRAGDTLVITDGRGRELRGQLNQLAATSLELLVGGTTQTLTEQDVRTIRQKRPDSLANGAKWGLGVGAAFGGLAGIALAGEIGAGQVPAVVLIYGALGTAAGVGIDALRSSAEIIYSRPPTGSARVSVSPLMGPRGHGVRLSIRF